jgi:hypothetical protein
MRPAAADPLDKIVTFVPTEAAEHVLAAMAGAGAGRIGSYEGCSWRTGGLGTFTPLPGAEPFTGTVGQPERVPETRLEMALPRGLRAAVVAALRSAHPYEEPAFDVVELALPAGPRGLGRVGRLEVPEPLRAFADRVANALPSTAAGIRVAGDPERLIRTVAVCGGAGDDLLEDARALGVDAFVTADLRHHPSSESLAEGGPALVDCPHWASEWPWLLDAETRLLDRLTQRGVTVQTRVSRLVTDPWTSIARSTEPGELR